MKLIKRFIYLFTKYTDKAFNTGKFSFFDKDEVLSDIDNDIAHSLKLRVRSRNNSSKHSPINSVSQSTEFHLQKGQFGTHSFGKSKLKNLAHTPAMQQSMGAQFQSDIAPEPYKSDFEKVDIKDIARRRKKRKTKSDLQKESSSKVKVQFEELQGQKGFKRQKEEKPSFDFEPWDQKSGQ